MKQFLRRVLSWLLVLCMVLGFLPAAYASGVTWEKTEQKITAAMSDRLVQQDGTAEHSPGESVRVSIVLDKPSAVEAGFSTMGISSNQKAMNHRAQLHEQQKVMEKTISDRVLKGRPLDVARKIVFVSNGTLSYSDKANYAVAKGATAVVVCDGDDNAPYMDLSGYYYTNPVIAIGRTNAQAIREASTKVSDIAYTGKMTVYGRPGAGVSGGNIHSVWGSDKYETMSGTSVTTFSPNASCTRAQVVTFLHAAMAR